VTKRKKEKKPSGLQPIRNSTRVKRNQPCPCGSGKKAKRCCLGEIKALEAIPAEFRARFVADSILWRPIVNEIVNEIEELTWVDPTDSDCQLEVTSEEQP
jgi:hypothetical protein